MSRVDKGIMKQLVSRMGSNGCSGRESGRRKSSDHAFESYYETLVVIVTSTTSHDPVQNCVEGVALSQVLLFNYDCGGPGTRLVRKNIAKPYNPVAWVCPRKRIPIILCHHDESVLQPCTSTWPAGPKEEEALSH